MSKLTDTLQAAEHRLSPGQPVRLGDLSSRGRDFHNNRDEAETEFLAQREKLIELQRRLYAEGRRKLLIVLQAMDAGGKDGTIRHVFCGTNPQGVLVTSFKPPTDEELSHDFLWRVHRAVPAAGMIGIFNRSHYEDVLVPRVENLVPEETWRQRFLQINDFERLLSETGTTVVKFFLRISHDEQEKRLRDRLTDPSKHWKFSPDDVVKRRHWDLYVPAYEEALSVWATDRAPWYVIPADQKWYRNLAVVRVITQTLRDMNPQFPPPQAELSQHDLD